LKERRDEVVLPNLEGLACNCIAVSPDESSIAIGCAPLGSVDKSSQVKVLRIATKTELFELRSPEVTGRVTSLAFANDNLGLWCASDSGQLTKFDLLDRRKAHSVKLPGPIARIALSPSGKEIAIGLSSPVRPSSLYILKTNETFPEEAQALNYSGIIHDLSYSPSGDLIAWTANLGKVFVFDLKNNVRLLEVEIAKQTSDVRAGFGDYCRFSPDGGHLVAGGDAKCLRVWKVNESGIHK